MEIAFIVVSYQGVLPLPFGIRGILNFRNSGGDHGYIIGGEGLWQIEILISNINYNDSLILDFCPGTLTIHQKFI